MSNDKKRNHLYPVFHIKKWINNGGKVYIKKNRKIRNVKLQEDFSLSYYYSLGQHNSVLEDRISKFESVISEVIKKIDEACEKVVLTGKELELLKLYCVLCGSRQEFTSEVIKYDESGIYQSNNFILGLHRNVNQKQVVKVTEHIMDDFDKIQAMNNDAETWLNPNMYDTKYIYSTYTMGLHLAIVRASKPILCISDRFCIIENTLDSDFLYSYVPVSPKTAIFLVKSKYFYDYETYMKTKLRLGFKYGNGKPDPYLSVILYKDIFHNYEDRLFCSYSKVKSCVHSHDAYLTRDKVKKVTILINNLPDDILRQFNSIFCEDGNKILFCDKDELDKALKLKLDYRYVKIDMI